MTGAVDTARILVVDDTGANRALLRAMLGPLGLSIEEAKNGEEAIALAECTAFDLILMDVHMPRVDGLTAARAIRAGNGPCRSIPILALSADVTADNATTFIEAGMDDSIAKPIAFDELVGKIAAWLDQADAAPVAPRTGSGS